MKEAVGVTCSGIHAELLDDNVFNFFFNWFVLAIKSFGW